MLYLKLLPTKAQKQKVTFSIKLMKITKLNDELRCNKKNIADNISSGKMTVCTLARV
jgi:hypothetical protein